MVPSFGKEGFGVVAITPRQAAAIAKTQQRNATKENGTEGGARTV